MQFSCFGVVAFHVRFGIFSFIFNCIKKFIAFKLRAKFLDRFGIILLIRPGLCNLYYLFKIHCENISPLKVVTQTGSLVVECLPLAWFKRNSIPILFLQVEWHVHACLKTRIGFDCCLASAWEQIDLILANFTVPYHTISYHTMPDYELRYKVIGHKDAVKIKYPLKKIGI